MRLFVVWRRLSVRTVELAERIGARVAFIRDRPPYIQAWMETSRLVSRLKPDTLLVPGTYLVQSPQGPLLYRALRLREKHGFVLVADMCTRRCSYTSLGRACS